MVISVRHGDAVASVTTRNSRTMRSHVSQRESSGKGVDMSELQAHHCITPDSGVRRKFSWGGGVGSGSYGGHLYLVFAVCDVISMFPNQRFGEVS